MTLSEQAVGTPYGPGRLVTYPATSPRATVLLSHGAGQGIEVPDLLALAAGLPERGYSVALFEQPWRVAGKKVATAPATLDAGLLAAIAVLADSGTTGGLVLGGRSAGARSASRVAATAAGSLQARSAQALSREGLPSGLLVVGVLALAFPLHPPGRPEASRVGELEAVPVPTLVVQGDRDTFGGPDEFPAGTTLQVVAGGDHSFRVTKGSGLDPDEVLRGLVAGVADWLQELIR